MKTIEISLPKSAMNQYRMNFMVRVPVYDWYVDQLEIFPKVEIDRVYYCLDCHDTGLILDEELGEINCVCRIDHADEPNQD